MADILSSTPDEQAAEANPRVIGLDDEAAGDLLDALSSDTARNLLVALHDEPDTPAALAERVDTSLQNAQYHLDRMTAAGVIEVVDTIYSEKGREMSVYGPTDRPLVVFAGTETERSGLAETLRSLVGGLVGLTVGTVVIEWLVGGSRSVQSAETATGEAAPTSETIDAVRTGAETATTSGVPPGVLFFLGGLLVLGTVLALQHQST